MTCIFHSRPKRNSCTRERESETVLNWKQPRTRRRMAPLDISPRFNAEKIIRSKWDTGRDTFYRNREPTETSRDRVTVLNKFMSYTQSPINYVFTSLRPVTYVWAGLAGLEKRPLFDEKLSSGRFHRRDFKRTIGGMLKRPFHNDWHLFRNLASFSPIARTFDCTMRHATISTAHFTN